jgi:hypothetical protein
MGNSLSKADLVNALSASMGWYGSELLDMEISEPGLRRAKSLSSLAKKRAFSLHLNPSGI